MRQSSTTNPDVESMKSAQNAAISSNEKVFPIFAKKLASKDSKDFANTTRKLADWLGSEKAYYPAARPKIVELLEIALSAFMDTFMRHPASAELGVLLRELIEAVKPFKRLLSEPELQSRLQRVIIDTERSLSPLFQRDSVPFREAVTATSPLLVSPVDAHLPPDMPPLLVPRKPVLQVLSTVQAVIPDGSVRADTFRARNSAEVASGQIVAHLSPTSPIANTPQEPGENVSPWIPSKPQPKRARRAELSEDLIARDLDWFKLNQAPAIVNEESGKAGESSLSLVSDTTHVSGPSPLAKKKTARIVPSRRLPRRIPTEGVQKLEPDSLVPFAEPLTGSSDHAEEVFTQDAKEQRPSLVTTQLAPIPDSHDTQAVSPHELSLPKAQSPGESPHEPLSVKSEIPQTDHRSPLIGTRSLNGESSISLHRSIPLLETALNEPEPMDISVSDLDPMEVLPEPPILGPTPPESPVVRLRSPILPPLVGTWDPPLNLNFKISQTTSDQSAPDENRRRFDGEMTVVHSMQGKPFTHTHMIDISLEECIFTKITRWVNRRSQPLEAPQGVCLSLACYRLPDFFSTVKSGIGKFDTEALTLQSSCAWPHLNRLSLRVNDEARHITVTLSPPFFLTPDQCVDISSLMKPGNNTLEIRQHGDLSEYLIVLHAHHPTRAQLCELDAVKIADERWKRFLDALSARVTPNRSLSVSPAGVVGAACNLRA